MTHVAVDATCWSNSRGYGRYIRGLLPALVRLDSENRYTLLTDAPAALDHPAGAEVRPVPTSLPTAVAASAHGRRSLRDLWRMSRALADPSFDLILFPTVYSFVPVLGRARKVVVIHDVIVESYPQLALPGRVARLLWYAKVALARRQADAVVTVSEYSRQALLRRFSLQPEQVSVVGEASDPVFRPLASPQPTAHLTSLGITPTHRLVLYVGGFGPHKNLGALLAVFARLTSRAEYADLRLLMVGEHQREVFHTAFGSLEQQVKALGLGDRVVFTGYLPDEELVVLLNLATVLVLPSLMEGFGLPAVEAAGCGCPVVATRASPLPALLGEGGIYVDPTRPEELERGLARVLSSDTLRRGMRSTGLAAARRLTWERAAREMMAVMQQVTAE